MHAAAAFTHEERPTPAGVVLPAEVGRARCKWDATHHKTFLSQPAAVLAGWPLRKKDRPRPRPARRRRRDAKHLGVWGESPSGCRAEPCRQPRRLPARRGRGVQGQGPAASRAGCPPGEGAGCRGKAPPPAAQAARPARAQSAGARPRRGFVKLLKGSPIADSRIGRFSKISEKREKILHNRPVL